MPNNLTDHDIQKLGDYAGRATRLLEEFEHEKRDTVVEIFRYGYIYDQVEAAIQLVANETMKATLLEREAVITDLDVVFFRRYVCGTAGIEKEIREVEEISPYYPQPAL